MLAIARKYLKGSALLLVWFAASVLLFYKLHTPDGVSVSSQGCTQERSLAREAQREVPGVSPRYEAAPIFSGRLQHLRDGDTNLLPPRSLRPRPDIAPSKTVDDDPQPPAGGGRRNVEEEEEHEMVERRFKERLSRLHKACRLYYNTTTLFRPKPAGYVPMPMYRPVMNASVRYCPIAKTSATTWTHFFSDIRQHMLKNNVQPSEDRSQADDVIHFTFVREPYARLLSAYVDKLFTPNAMFWSMIGRGTVRRHRLNATQDSLRCGHDVTFPEFVQYVVESQRTGTHMNGHFMPTHDQCDMCTLPYRYIGHLETMREDMPFIIKAIRSPINYTRTYDRDTIAQNANMILWDKRVEQVLRCMDRDEASRRLWRKYQIRGLISKHESFPFPPGGAVNITLRNFTHTAWAAHERSKQNYPGLKDQRVEALREAFAGVPMHDRLQAQATHFLDFQMFGFDPYLEDVFPQTPYVKDKDFSYFDIYD